MNAGSWRQPALFAAAVALTWMAAASPARHADALGVERFAEAGLDFDAPALAFDVAGRGLLVARGHDASGDRLCAWFQPPGEDWGSRIDVASGPALFAPRVAALPRGGFAICWSAGAGADCDVFAVRAAGGGIGPVERVSDRPGADTEPSLAVAPDGTPWVAWQGVDGDRTDVFAAARTDGAWAVRRVTDEPTSDLQPSLAFDAAGRAWVAWSSWRHGRYADGNYELYVQALEDGAEPRRVTASDAADLEPTLVAAGDELALVWTESYFPTRRNDRLVTVGYDRWADKVLKVARGKDGAFGPPRELRLTGNARDGSTIANRAFPIAAPRADESRLWIVHGSLAVDPPAGAAWIAGTHFRARVLVDDPDGASEPVDVGGAVLGPARRFGLAWRGDELVVAQVGHVSHGLPAPTSFVELTPLSSWPEPRDRPLAPRTAGERKPPVPGLMADQPTRAQRSTRSLDGRTLTAWFGNLHLHSDLSRDAVGFEGSPAMNYQVVYDLAGLDFAGLSDHVEPFTNTDWPDVLAVSDLWDRSGVFVTLPGYEWTSLSYGHRNVFFPDTPTARADATFGATAPDGERTPEDLWRHLGERSALTIPHHISHALSKATDWSFHNDRFQRLVEIFQVRGNYEYDGAPYQKRDTQVPFTPGHSVRDALAAGHRVGIIASPDHGGGMGLAGVWAAELTRASIWDALYARRTFGTTGAKMDLFLEVAGAPMGSEVAWSGGPVELRATVHGTAPGLELVLVTDGEEVRTWREEGATAEIAWTAPAPSADESHYYYLRAQQGDGHLGWTSPVWLDPAGR